MTLPSIGILFGGMSEEHPISVKSATQVMHSLDSSKYDPHWVGITTDGRWRLCNGPTEGWEDAGVEAELSADRTIHGLLVHGAQGTTTIRLDAVLPVLHGKMGEDGAIQGLLELSGIPYVGCDIPSSAICMDKSLAYVVAQAVGIATPQWQVVTPHDRIDANALSYPLFVKPARSGSSFGVNKVEHPGELQAAVRAAHQYDSKVLVEEAIAGKEIGCAVMGTYPDLTVGRVDHVALTSGFLRIHQEKTPESGSQNSQFIVPADIPDDDQLLVQNEAKKVYRALGCSGLARVDMFLTDRHTVVLNEVNTLPGLTSYSRFPRMMAAAGMPMRDVLDRLLGAALATAD